MKISMIGTGYVGLVSGSCLANIGHFVTCIDIDQAKIDVLNRGESPIYEPGLSEIITNNIKSNRLFFSTNYESVKNADAIFLAVGTPSGKDGRANLSYLESAASSVASFIKHGAVIVIKSTVPLGTWKTIDKIIKEKTDKSFYIVNNPEFLKEGSAIEDFIRPDRIVIGCRDQLPKDIMSEIYAPLLRTGNPILFMSNTSAEMTKYAANAFLASKISFINEIARLCDSVGADVEEVRSGIASDVRIGKHFLYPGPGYGGSCFPKDVQALLNTASDHDIKLNVVIGAEQTNDCQKSYMFSKIMNYYNGNIKGKVFAFWGAAFKARTDDVRESPAIVMAKLVIDNGGVVEFFDPKAKETFLKYFKDTSKNSRYLDSIFARDDMYSYLKNCDALVVMTEWRDFQSPDYQFLEKSLKDKVIFDSRNLFCIKSLKKYDLQYFAIGKYLEE